MHKKYLTFLALFIFPLFYCTGQVVDFYHQYSANNNLVLFSIDTTHDGGYVSTGWVHNSGGGDYLVIKVDSSGNEIWRRQNQYFNQLDSESMMSCVKELQDHSYILSGYIDHFSPPIGLIYQSYISKIDSTGNMVWEKFLGDTSQELAFNIATFSDNTFLVVGKKYVSNSVVTLTKFNSNGDSLWRREVNYPGYNVGKSLIENCSNTDCIVLTELSNSGSGLMRIDSSGSLIDSTIFTYHNTNFPLAILEYKLNNYYTILESNGPFSKLIKLDSALNIVIDTNIAQLFTAVIVDSNAIYGAVPNLYCFKLNTFGDTLWSNYINEQFGVPAGITVNRQGCPVICGNIDDANNTISVGFILKVCDSLLLTSTPSIQSNIANIYPNPFQNQLTIKLNQNILSDLNLIDIYLYNESGQYIDSFKPNDFTYIIRTDTLMIGTYYIKIFYNKYNVISNKILIK